MDLATVLDLLKEEEPKHPAPIQHGPLRHYDNVMRCASRGCGSATNYRLRGIPYCMTHSLRLMNDMLTELGVE